jgi:DNA polymerase I
VVNFDGLPFGSLWAVDFEYRSLSGERPWPVCMCARELRAGQELRLWRDELLALRRAPFDVGPDAVMIAYAAAAELSCFLELGWPLPVNVIDLFAEHRIDTNGLRLACGNGLLAALAIRGLAHIDAGEKQAMRDLIVNRASWTPEEQREILDYCMSDVVALAALLHVMAPTLELPLALLRGRYGAAVARMERAGIPIDAPLYRQVVDNWEGLKLDLIADVDAAFGVYDGVHFRMAGFAAWLEVHAVSDWPLTEVSGGLALDDDTFLEQIALHPELAELQSLRELRATLGRMRLIGLEIGADGRNRCALMPFQAITGRNLPSSNKFLFGPARWLRSFAKPPAGYGLAYLDFSAEEIAIGAALSGDDVLAQHYADGDIYLNFAVAAGLAPVGATKQSHPNVRQLCKALFLAIGYGMGSRTLGQKSGVANWRARELIELHRRTYSKFAKWREDTVDGALLGGRMRTTFGWRRRAYERARPSELMAWPIQSAGADLMRIVTIAATEAGIEVACPVHDGFMIVSPLDRLEHDAERMRAIMTKAGSVVTGGLPIRVDCDLVRFPDRYVDERGRAMWDRIMGLMKRRAGVSAAA